MSENRMNNITMAVNLNLSQALDMTYIYGRVSAMCMMFDLRCPVILTNQRLPIGINSIWIRSKNDLFRIDLTKRKPWSLLCLRLQTKHTNMCR